MDGRRVKSCLSLAALVEGLEIVTIEGLAQGDTLHPLQAAFIERDAFQCGYCTPGTDHGRRRLQPGEVITAITVPASAAARRSHYLEVRDRASFDFALVSAAVALDLDRARIRRARVALGGVGTKPWRVPQVEKALVGARLEPATLRRAAALAAHGARGAGHNDFKIELMQRAIVRAIETVGARA